MSDYTGQSSMTEHWKQKGCSVDFSLHLDRPLTGGEVAELGAILGAIEKYVASLAALGIHVEEAT